MGFRRIVLLFSIASLLVWPPGKVWAGEAPALTPTQTVLDGAGGLQGLDGVRAIAVGPGGLDVYTAATEDDALVHWSRTSEGGLEQREILRAGFDGLEALDGITHLALSMDGRFLYALTELSILLTFERNFPNGSLTLRQTFAATQVSDLIFFSTVFLSPGGLHLYALGESEGRPALFLFERDSTTGALQHLRVIVHLDGTLLGEPFRAAVAGAFSRDGRHLYVTAGDGLIILNVDPVTGDVDLEQIEGQVRIGGAVALSPDERFVYVVNRLGDEAFLLPGAWVLSRDSSTGRVQVSATCCGGEELGLSLTTYSSLVVAQEGGHLYASSVFREVITHLYHDEAVDELVLVENIVNDPTGETTFKGPGQMALSSDGIELYATGEKGDSLLVFDRSSVDGKISLKQALQDGDGEEAFGFADIESFAWTPNGEFLFTAGEDDEAIAIFRRVPGAARLEFVDSFEGDVSDPVRFLEQILVSPDGRLLVAVSRNATVRTFAIDATLGALSLLETVRFSRDFRFVQGALSSDGRQLYVRAELNLLTMDIDSTTGEVQLIQRIGEFENPSGVVDLLILRAMAVSPDGRHVYLVDVRHGLLTFSRSEDDGRLTLSASFNADFRDGLRSVRGMDLIVSKDGRNAYVVVPHAPQDRLIVLDRDRATGALIYVEDLPIAEPGEEAITFIRDLVASDDGLYLYAVDMGTNRVHSFLRNRSTGRLTPAGTRQNGQGGLNGFLNPGVVSVSPESELIVVGTDAGLQVFRAGPPECPADGQGLCLQDDRFAVTVDWERRNGATGIGQSVPFGSDDSGLLWFFAEDNWEMLVKVLDGCANNGHYWVFSAATTNVEYTLNVADRLTGLRRSYTNPQGTSAAALTDTRAFATCPAPAAAAAEAGDASTVVPAISSIFPLPEPRNTSMALASGTCVADDVTLCLNENRFKVEVAWTRANGVTGVGSVVPFGSDDSGLLWFFNGANWEMLIKVLDGCANNGHYWVFSAATTNVEYTLRVTDTVTGTMKEYFNPQGNRASAITDTRAFETCG